MSTSDSTTSASPRRSLFSGTTFCPSSIYTYVHVQSLPWHDDVHLSLLARPTWFGSSYFDYNRFFYGCTADSVNWLHR
jgi:hypothetical protein